MLQEEKYESLNHTSVTGCKLGCPKNKQKIDLHFSFYIYGAAKWVEPIQKIQNYGPINDSLPTIWIKWPVLIEKKSKI